MKRELKKCIVNTKTILICILVCLFQSCDNTDMPETERVTKKVSVCFEGDPEGTYPWLSFVAYTENHETLYVIQDGDTIIKNDGTFGILKGEIPLSGKIVLYSKMKETEWIYLGVTYRKRMSNPSEADELKIRIKGYINDIQYLDTVQTMRAFRKDEEIGDSDYMYDLKI